MPNTVTKREINLSKAVQKGWEPKNRVLFFLPIGTVIVVLITAALGIAFSVGDLVILAFLTLFCLDALTERINILGGIESKLDDLKTDAERRSGDLEAKFDKVIASRTLRPRSALPHFDEEIADAVTVDLLLISGNNLIPRYIGLLERKLMGNCKLRIILLKPDLGILKVYEKLTGWDRTEADIKTTLAVLRRIMKSQNSRTNCEIRLMEPFLPFTIIGADINMDRGSLLVEYHGYKINPDERLHFISSPQNNYELYVRYCSQFEKAWGDAESITDLEFYLKE